MSAVHKLLFILHDRPDYPSGPIVNYLRLLPRLKARGFEIHLLAVYGKDYPNARALQLQGISIYPLKRTFTEMLVKAMLEKVEQIQPDVFIPDVSAQGCLAGTWVKASGIPVINTHRSDDALNWGKAVYFTDAAYGQQLSGIVCVNQFLRDELMRRVTSTSVLTEVIPSGVIVPSYAANQERQGLKVVYAGRLIEKQKQVGTMIKSFLTLAEKLHDITFTIIGDGPGRKDYGEMIASSPHSDRFQFTGRLEGEAYKRLLAEHQVIVLLSDYEGTPGSLMDGMSCGLIPVSLRYPGIDELVHHEKNGLIVGDRNRSFHDAVQKLSADPMLRKKLSEAARSHIVNHYSVEKAEARWITFMENCKKAAGEAKPFVMPKKIVLPSYNSLLVEDRRLEQASLLSKLKAAISTFIGS
jgi:glycosyltransferase involved in cell wall biosynthesis